jgi:outer membrane receptor protein involved in Fe transport
MTGNVTWDLSSVDSLQVGLDASEDFASSPDAVDGSIRNFAEARHLALMLEGGTEPLPGVRFVASLRSQHDRQDISPQNAPAQETKITQTIGKLGLNWKVSESWRVYTSMGTGFSNPLLSNTLWNVHYGGEALNNEKSRFVQAGASYCSPVTGVRGWIFPAPFSRAWCTTIQTLGHISRTGT